jgi:hypothetical protein
MGAFTELAFDPMLPAPRSPFSAPRFSVFLTPNCHHLGPNFKNKKSINRRFFNSSMK